MKNLEIEAKFAVDPFAVTPNLIEEFLGKVTAGAIWNRGERNIPEYGVDVERYLEAEGVDRFYDAGTGIVRHRRDDIWAEGADEGNRLRGDPLRVHEQFTVKRRRGTTLRVRDEVDLNVGPQAGDFLRLLGLPETLAIQKTYWVHFLEGVTRKFGREAKHSICVALYNVRRMDDSDSKWFLEIEVEKESDVKTKEAERICQMWAKALQAELKLGAPGQESLYEIYTVLPDKGMVQTQPGVFVAKSIFAQEFVPKHAIECKDPSCNRSCMKDKPA